MLSHRNSIVRRGRKVFNIELHILHADKSRGASHFPVYIVKRTFPDFYLLDKKAFDWRSGFLFFGFLSGQREYYLTLSVGFQQKIRTIEFQPGDTIFLFEKTHEVSPERKPINIQGLLSVGTHKMYLFSQNAPPAKFYIFYSEALAKKLLEFILEYLIGIVNEEKQD